MTDIEMLAAIRAWALDARFLPQVMEVYLPDRVVSLEVKAEAHWAPKPEVVK